MSFETAARAVLVAWDDADPIIRLDLSEDLWNAVENLRRAVAKAERTPDLIC